LTQASAAEMTIAILSRFFEFFQLNRIFDEDRKYFHVIGNEFIEVTLVRQNQMNSQQKIEEALKRGFDTIDFYDDVIEILSDSNWQTKRKMRVNIGSIVFSSENLVLFAKNGISLSELVVRVFVNVKHVFDRKTNIVSLQNAQNYYAVILHLIDSILRNDLSSSIRKENNWILQQFLKNIDRKSL